MARVAESGSAGNREAAMATEISGSGTRAAPSSSARVVSCQCRVAASLELGLRIRCTIRAKIKEIVFEGNTVFSSGALKHQMKKLKEAGFWNLSWLGGKTTYTEDKWSGGAEDPRGDLKSAAK